VLLVLGLLGASAVGRTGWRAGEREPPGGEPDGKDIDKMLQDTLRDVLNRGADLYNSVPGDVNGCYRLFEGALMAVKPMLRHRPELQKAIEGALASAEREPVMWRRAFALRGVIVKIRREVGGKTKPEDKKPEDKGPDKKGRKAKRASVMGVVTLDGRPFPGGTITFHPAKGKPYTATVNSDGTYEFKGAAALPPGVYVVTFRRAPAGPEDKTALPAKYTDPKKSGLTARVKLGEENVIPFDLKSEKKAPDKKPDEKGDVEGKVTYKGAPLPGGTVTFVGGKGSFPAPLKEVGTYSVKALPVGEYRIAVETESVKAKKGPRFVAIPAKYADPDTSGLTVKVTKGKQTHDIVLE
jgi:hypothetical protein